MPGERGAAGISGPKGDRVSARLTCLPPSHPSLRPHMQSLSHAPVGEAPATCLEELGDPLRVTLQSLCLPFGDFLPPTLPSTSLRLLLVTRP